MGIQARQRVVSPENSMTKAQELGRSAEDIGAEYLVSLGWKVLSRNVRNRYGELDITALDTKVSPEELVIVEVRCRTVGKTQGALESIGMRKLRILARASAEYADDVGWTGFCRIDVVGITVRSKDSFEDMTIEHVRDVTAGMNIP